MPHVKGGWTTPQSFQADREADVLGCIREVVDDVLCGEKGAVGSKRQFSD